MKILSFNINGLRARPHQLEEIIKLHAPDVIALQETKVHDDQFPLEMVAPLGYHVNFYGQKAHYGVAMLTKNAPISVQKGFPTDDVDAQRRLIIAKIDTPKGVLTVINGYFPQGESRDHPLKFPAKQRFYADLTQYLNTHHKPTDLIAIVGDMNISCTDRDIGLKPENKKRWLQTGKCSFLPEEREWMQTLFDFGLIDTFRAQHPDCTDQFSWFDYRSKGFNDNIGLRIDLILCSQPLANYCTKTGIDYAIRAMEKPSDHAPVWAEFNLK